MNPKAKYHFITACEVDPAKLPPEDQALLREYRRRLNNLVAKEEMALKLAVEQAMETAPELNLDKVKAAIAEWVTPPVASSV